VIDERDTYDDGLDDLGLLPERSTDKRYTFEHVTRDETRLRTVWADSVHFARELLDTHQQGSTLTWVSTSHTAGTLAVPTRQHDRRENR
jgi:hypothetical protein